LAVLDALVNEKGQPPKYHQPAGKSGDGGIFTFQKKGTAPDQRYYYEQRSRMENG